MKITRRDLGVIMIIAGILIGFLAYKMNFEGTMEEVETLQEEQKNLEGQIKELEPLIKESEKWEKAKKEIATALDKMVGEFSPDIWQEDNIMTVVDMLDNLKTEIKSFSAEPAKVIETVVGEGSLSNKSYSLARAFITMSYKSEDYQALKDYINYVYADEDGKRLIDHISMSFNKEDGSIAGSTTIFDYVMNDGTKKYEAPELPDDNLGIENENDNAIFGETEEAEEEK